jgi:predicted amidohydrolase YtcJ
MAEITPISSIRRPPRAARLHVLVDTQPAWHYKDVAALSTGLGRERLEHFIGLKSLRQAGVEVAIDTDHMLGLDPDGAMNPSTRC